MLFPFVSTKPRFTGRGPEDLTLIALFREARLLISSRRQFLLNASMLTTGALLQPSLRAAAVRSQSPEDVPISAKRLDTGWEFRQGPIDGIWAAWRTEDNDQWQPATLPHCFNADDACDPDKPYFRGQGWYRTRIDLANPFSEGRTILHFQGAGQTTTLWVGSELIGTHKGGYTTNFTFDITEAVRRLPIAETKQGVPIAPFSATTPLTSNASPPTWPISVSMAASTAM